MLTVKWLNARQLFFEDLEVVNDAIEITNVKGVFLFFSDVLDQRWHIAVPVHNMESFVLFFNFHFFVRRKKFVKLYTKVLS